MLRWVRKNALGLSSALVAIAALSLAVYEGRQTRTHNRLSVQPYLDLKFHAEWGEGGWVLESLGAGPAVPRYFEVLVDGAPLEHFVAMREALGIGKGFCGSQQSFDYGEFIPSGGRRRLYWSHSEWAAELIANAASRVEMALCYCSIYGELIADECWTVRWPPSGVKRGDCPSHPTFKPSTVSLSSVNDELCEAEGITR
jgi:hypothetical protein